MSPSRRTLIRTCGVALSAAVGGCLSSSGGSPTTDTEPTAGAPSTDGPNSTTDSTTTPKATTAPPEVREVAGVDRNVPSALAAKSSEVEPSEDPFRSFAVGSRENVSNPDDNELHVLAVWNATGEALTVELELTADVETILDDRYEFESGASLAIELREPGRYELAVHAGDREEVATVERGRFDCNDSATDVAIRDDEIETGWITTELACSTTAGGA